VSGRSEIIRPRSRQLLPSPGTAARQAHLSTCTPAAPPAPPGGPGSAPGPAGPATAWGCAGVVEFLTRVGWLRAPTGNRSWSGVDRLADALFMPPCRHQWRAVPLLPAALVGRLRRPFLPTTATRLAPSPATAAPEPASGFPPGPVAAWCFRWGLLVAARAGCCRLWPFAAGGGGLTCSGWLAPLLLDARPALRRRSPRNTRPAVGEPPNDPAGGPPRAAQWPGRVGAALAVTTGLAFFIDPRGCAWRSRLALLAGACSVLCWRELPWRLPAGCSLRWLQVYAPLGAGGYLAVGLVGLRLLPYCVWRCPSSQMPEWGG